MHAVEIRAVLVEHDERMAAIDGYDFSDPHFAALRGGAELVCGGDIVDGGLAHVFLLTPQSAGEFHFVILFSDRRLRRRQRDPDQRSFADLRFHGKASALHFDKGPRDRETDAGAGE
jgi:hypothetical protein